MILAINVGNSNIAFGIKDGDTWRSNRRLRTVATRTVDEYLLQVASLLEQDSIDRSVVSGVVIASVVPELLYTFAKLSEKLFGLEALLVTSSLDSGLTIDIHNPRELGADLLANAVAGYDLAGANVVVVDFGTALTFTAVESPGVLRGVSIAPGIRSAMMALAGNTAQLPHVELKLPDAAIGRNTTQSIQSGILFGYEGLVANVVRRMSSEMGGKTQVFATGGFSGSIAIHYDIFDRIESRLTLDGLVLLGKRNGVT